MYTITNEKIGVYIDVNPASSPSYHRLGEGINAFTPSNNGQISTKHYINAKFANSKRTGLQKQWAISGDRAIGDAVNDYLVGLSEKIGNDVETTMLVVELHKKVTAGGVTTAPAKKFKVMIDLANDGSVEGGADVAIDGTIYANGDPIEGTATLGVGDTASFTATVASQVAKPVIGIDDNNSTSVKMMISCETAGANIYYTTDGTDPTSSSTAYSSVVTLSTAGTYTIKAIALKSNVADSEIVSTVVVVTSV